MREYEFVFIVKATETDEAIETLIEQMQEVATAHDAEVTKVDRWGRRRLAYEIAKEREGFYVMFEMRAGEEAIKELERRMRMNDVVLRYLTVRVDDEMRRAVRRASLRAKRKRISPEALEAIRVAARPSSDATASGVEAPPAAEPAPPAAEPAPPAAEPAPPAVKPEGSDTPAADSAQTETGEA